MKECSTPCERGRMPGRRLSAVFRRRVPQFLCVYAAGAWAIVELVALAVEGGHASVWLLHSARVVLALLVPCVVVAVWRLGAGDDVDDDADAGLPTETGASTPGQAAASPVRPRP